MSIKRLYCAIALFTLVLLAKCRPSESKLNYLPTKHIDTAAYKQLQKQFNLNYVFKSHEYLGDLTPNYPLAFASQMLFDHQGKTISRDTDGVDGGFFPSVRKIIVKKDSTYILLNNRQEVKRFYAPISSPEEALAYATLYNRSFAAFGDFFNKKKYKYVGDKPASSYSVKKDEYYEVHLFSYKAFGCDHPYFSEVFKVDKDGSVTLISKKRSFTDPADDHMCVD